MLCASFVVQVVVLGSALPKLCSTKRSILQRLFCVNASVSQAFVCKSFLCPMVFLCKRLLSDSKSFLACRTAEMSREEFRGDEKGWSVLRWDENSWELRRTYLDDMWEEMGWDEKSWDEVRRAHMIWDEIKCKCEVWSAGCEACSMKCEESVHLELHCTGVLRRPCSWTTTTTTTAQQIRTKHALTGLAGALCMQVLYRWESSCMV